MGKRMPKAKNPRSRKVATSAIRIYLAGPFSKNGRWPDWRDRVKHEAPYHFYFDPRFDSEQLASVTFTLDDLRKGAGAADMVFGYNPRGNYHVDPFGLCIELGMAFGCRVPIILCDENDWVFPMLPPLARRLFTDLTLAIRYLKLLRSDSNEFHVFYKAVDTSRGRGRHNVQA